MRWLLNTLYGALLLLLCPVIAWRMIRHGRYRRGLREKLTGRLQRPSDARPVVWFHAVSVGEVIQLQKLVKEFRQQTAEACSVLVTVSTDTGFDIACQKFPDCAVTWFPLDFSWAVENALHAIRPALVVLVELELWPNFLQECQRRQIPVAVVNARMSERSFQRYRSAGRILTPVFSQIRLVAAQSPANGERLVSLGVAPDRLHITGSIKFDGVETHRKNPGTLRLRSLFGLKSDDLVLVAGSTQEPEERIVLEAWMALRQDFPHLRLILVPRHRERFDAVASQISATGLPLARRSLLSPETHPPETSAVLLLDTIGELSACWGLAEIAFVGGSFGNRGGQNMIEPAGYGAAVTFGPNTWNFRDVVTSFRDAAACLEIPDPDQLLPVLRTLCQDPEARRRLGTAAAQVVLSQQGATQRTAALLRQVLLEAARAPGNSATHANPTTGALSGSSPQERAA